MVVILDEIGKTQAITTGFVVSGGRIEQVKVLTYRESIGSEVRRTSFTNQFKGASLEESGKLSKRINNIAGATLSVRAVTEMARVALYLEQVSPEVR
jgi:Na+-translocating ferredoxin:NAD+ oxidoreductase RnfG subunit